MEEILGCQSELDNRIYVGNKSAIKINNKWICYYDFLLTTTDEQCLKALQNIVPKINMDDVYLIIENTPYLSKIAITFHKTMLKARYEKMLVPAFERANKIRQK